MGYEDATVEALIHTVKEAGTRCSLEESVVMALPASLAKRDRGPFDAAVVDEVERRLRSKVIALEEAVEVAAAPLAARAATVQGAQIELERALSEQVEAIDGLRDSQEARCVATAAAEAAKTAVGDVEA